MTVRVVNLFFYIQQFITWSMRADCGSYFVTTYKTSKLHEERKRKEEKKLRKRKGKGKEKNKI